MKLTTLLLILNFIQVGATTLFSQNTRFNLKIEQLSIKDVLTVIENQSNYKFVYRDNDIVNKRISLNTENESIDAVLGTILNNTGMEYKILANNLIVIASSKEIRQQKLSGTVIDATSGEPIIGVAIVEKGHTTGTTTDINGTFSLMVTNPNATIVVTYIGYESQEIAIAENPVLNIKLVESVTGIKEIVVTALGIKREKKALGYSVQEVQGESLVESRDNQNVINELSGKVAGLNISTAGDGGGSSNISIRGQTSIMNTSQPLLVVDGVIVSNYNGGSDDQWGNRAVDHGSTFQDFNPDDIESISVLKGAQASALYGSQAANGVILITTKIGHNSDGKIGITISSNNQFSTPLSYIPMQNSYAQGTSGVFQVNGITSWGPQMTGQMVTDWTGQTRPLLPVNNNLLTYFLRTGFTTTNNLEVSTGNDKVNFVGSVSDMQNTGFIPNSGSSRVTVNIRTTVNFTSKLNVDVKANYIHSTADNKPKIGFDPDNIFINYLMMPRNIRLSDLANYVMPSGLPTRYDYSSPGNVEQGGYILNPYWTVNRNTNHETRDRIMGMASITYKILPGLEIRFREGLDYWNSTYTDLLSTGVPYWFPTGDYKVQMSNSMINTTETFINYSNKSIAHSKFALNLMAGSNYATTQTDLLTIEDNGLIVPDFFAYSNAMGLTLTDNPSKQTISSMLGSGEIAYDNWAFLDITARNDWSSTLNPANWSYFYPSYNLSWVVSDMCKSLGKSLPSAISFLKLRGGYAEVGNGTNPYATELTYSLQPMTSTVSGAVPPPTFPLSNIKPERTKSFELGMDLRFFQNRIGLDFAYYKKNTYNTIINLSDPPSTGYPNHLINAGNIQNSGEEFTLNIVPIKLANGFEWDMNINWNKNVNKVISLYPGVTTQVLIPAPFTGPVTPVAVQGGSFGVLMGTTPVTNSNGKVILDEYGNPSPTNTTQPIGNYLPLWTGGWNNSFSFKGFNLSFLIDVREGGNLYCGSLNQAYTSGTAQATVAYRNGGLIVPGVTQNNTPNATATNAQAYWSSCSVINSYWIRDASFVKLREVSFGYNLPKSMIKNTPCKSVKISFVGRNLALLVSHCGGLDPESAYSTSNGLGMELGSTPTLRNLGFNINFGF